MTKIVCCMIIFVLLSFGAFTWL